MIVSIVPFSFRDSLDRLSKNISERSEKSSFRRPVRDGKYDFRKCSAELVFQRLAEIDGCPSGVVAKGAAAPRAEHESRVAESLRNREHAMNPLLQQVAGFRLADPRCDGCRTCNEAQRPSLIQLCAVVFPKNRNIR